MKRARLFGLIAILIALVTLSGCDAILEGFYPEYGENYGGGGNAIGVWVEVTVPGSDIVNPQIAAVVEDAWSNDWISDVVTYWPNWSWDEEGNAILTAYIELYGLPGSEAEYREFRVLVWLDRTSEGSMGFPDFDEPIREAEWFPPGWSEPANYFWFPNDYGTWIEAEANLSIWSGEALNRDFVIDGQRVFNVSQIYDNSTLDTHDYYVIPIDGANNVVSELWWTLWGPNGEEAGGYASSDVLSIDFNGFTNGFYWLDIEVRYDDDWYEYKGFPFRIVQNEYGTLPYTANIQIDGMSDWPINVPDGTGVDYQYAIVDHDGNLVSANSGFANVTSNMLSFSASGITYNTTAVFDSDGVDTLEVEIDTNLDGEYDYYMSFPIGISMDEVTLGQVDFWFWSGDFRRIFQP